MCGSIDYLVLEIINRYTYNAAVGLWNLGVLMYMFLDSRFKIRQFSHTNE